MIAVHGPRLVLVVALNGVCLEFTEIDDKVRQTAADDENRTISLVVRLNVSQRDHVGTSTCRYSCTRQ